MSLNEYVDHYTEMPNLLYMIIVSISVVIIMHALIWLYSKLFREKALGRFEMYYEMIFSSSMMLFFIGLFFLIEHKYFPVSEKFYETWEKYNDFLLLFMLIISVILMNVVDRVIVPLKTITSEKRATLRMLAMLYMLFIFAYIKFVDNNNNYDAIIAYFIIMVIGRFVYFDASIREFFKNLWNMFLAIPILFLCLCTTGIMAYCGFSIGYLLRSNGVVLSLFIAHIFIIIEICIVHFFQRVLKLY